MGLVIPTRFFMSTKIRNVIMGQYGYVTRDDRGFSILGIGEFSTLEQAIRQLRLIIETEAIGIKIELWREEDNNVWEQIKLKGVC